MRKYVFVHTDFAKGAFHTCTNISTLSLRTAFSLTVQVIGTAWSFLKKNTQESGKKTL